jgi:hypothetical protein
MARVMGYATVPILLGPVLDSALAETIRYGYRPARRLHASVFHDAAFCSPTEHAAREVGNRLES